jgi:hypothetical protein
MVQLEHPRQRLSVDDVPARPALPALGRNRANKESAEISAVVPDAAKAAIRNPDVQRKLVCLDSRLAPSERSGMTAGFFSGQSK